MNKKNILALMALALLVHAPIWAQDVVLPLLGKGNSNRYVQLEVNGGKHTFMFDATADGLTINKPIFDDLKRKNMLSDQDLTGNVSFTMPDGSVVSAQTFNIKILQVGTATLNNIIGTLVPVNTAKPTVGQRLLEALGTVSADYSTNQLTISKQTAISPAKGGIIPVKPTGTVATGRLSAIATVKLIPCSNDDIAYMQALAQQLGSDPNFASAKIELEQRVPPQKAVDKVTEGAMTVRYFDTAMSSIIRLSEFLAPVNTVISNNAYSYPQLVQFENMLQYFGQPIPNYVEIWIRKE